ncbi:transcriptional regulator with XRE-family HTH domain [Deinococcus metalli]|uniref:Transcriptional regulator with XRE-family HTH domain n=1 Tax=Deinococcus metalli TaxID=1141878 RepID=A0A7W8KI42_9DEIO|nr:helix-turn-helix transcriptional regulator [Deinococcus metalli]MBB5378565.1 transcriptional regulator with XRE-family HTH domain [Deinococcus metalli]GHF58659.1 hypothetical protein GCM10017781_38680 [Deinococcus metalli]
MPRQRRAQTIDDSEAQHLAALGARIRLLRQQRDLGLEELAARAGLHRTHLWKIEKGKLNAGIISYMRIARELQMTGEELFSILDLPLS